MTGCSDEIRPLCRLLAFLNVPRADQPLIKILRFMTDDLAEVYARCPPICAYGEMACWSVYV
jgi:hypothetical protein